MKSRLVASTLLVALAMVGSTVAAPQRSGRFTDAQAAALLSRTERDIAQFRRMMPVSTGRGAYGAARGDDNIGEFLLELTDTTAHLRDHADRHQVITTDVEDVLARGARIDGYMNRHRQGPAVATAWNTVRADLDQLAVGYGVAWSWSQPRYVPAPQENPFYHRVSGTFQLDRARSDDARRTAELATRSLPPGQRDRVLQNLAARLEPPDMLSIDRVERTVTIASSRGPRVTFEADGLARTEPWQGGRSVTTRATFYGDQLMVSTTGNRGSDFTVTFDPVDTGRGLDVTRRVDSDNLPQPVTAHSYYRRTADQPDWNLYVPAETSGLLVPDGTILTAVLNNPLNTRSVRRGEGFTLTVRGPGPFDGAIIDGVVANVNGPNRPGNRADMIMDFQSIHLRNGRTSDFEGIINGVRLPDGTIVGVNNEGVVRGSQQSDEALQRGAVGAAVGAIIGALAGGGKGAAIGAAVGATSGAGTVYLDGRTELDLPPGTVVTILSIDPRSRR